MGLGSKIKEKLRSDKDHETSPRSAHTRPAAPGAYPDSSTEVPRTTHADTWQSTDSKGKTTSSSRSNSNDSNGMYNDDGLNEYTHMSSTREQPRHSEEDFAVPSPDSRIHSSNNNTNNGKIAKEQRQAPYWGSVGNGDRSPKNADMMDNSKSDKTISGNDGRHTRNTSQFQAPIGSVNHGRPQLVDDDAAMASSMVASQGYEPSQYGGGNMPHDGSMNQYNGYNMSRSGTINGREPVGASPTHNFPQGSLHGSNNGNRGVMGQSSPTQFSRPNGFENNDGRTSEQHYGPGHSGAKVMHTCQHCGNDNDITRYFSRDVVYRLS